MMITTTVSCKYKMEQKIKKGYFDSCPKHDVESMVESYFENPDWESFISPDDNKYHLNVSGNILYNGREAKAILQFELLEDDRWKINAFEINGNEQNDFMISALLDEMCSSAELAAAKAKEEESETLKKANSSSSADTSAAASENQSQPTPAVRDSAPAAAPPEPVQRQSPIYYRIQDPDGYSNLRKVPDGAIVRKVYPGERFEVVGQSGKYKNVKFSDGTSGYIHESRVVPAE